MTGTGRGRRRHNQGRIRADQAREPVSGDTPADVRACTPSRPDSPAGVPRQALPVAKMTDQMAVAALAWQAQQKATGTSSRIWEDLLFTIERQDGR
jgi:hypothetical protein